jgi:ribonucleotide reductase beta subunit family protein with ferritin-like domain
MDDKEHKHVVVSSFQSNLKTEDIAQEQSKVKDEASISPFAHQPEVHTNVFQYPFTSLLETSVKRDFVV